MQEMGAKTQRGGPHLLVLYWRAGGTFVVKGNGSGWMRWLLKQEGSSSQITLKITPISYPNHGDNRCALEPPFHCTLPM
jgi:hypothetical protein